MPRHNLLRPALPMFLPALMLLGGCATTTPSSDSAAQTVAATSAQLGSRQSVVHALLTQHEHWAGTPYRLGGSTRRGIDCSAFVQTTFSERLGQSLPRATEAQARVGRPIRRHELAAGDLLFFRTGKKTRHVGIYVDEGRFLHASTSQGVTISRLDNPYWNAAYWMARRP